MRPFLAYYGDDFTGSTDVLENLHCAGLKSVMFLEPPQPDQLARFGRLDAIGIAGMSRAMSVQQMEKALPPIFECLGQSGASIVHYKTCSTFDSSPQIGNIGKAIEIGSSILGSSPVPVVVGAPHLGRYQAFGNLFAKFGGDDLVYRLDCHPTMSRHPITPMTQADLRQVLASQANLKIDLIDLVELEVGDVELLAGRFNQSATDVVLIDLVNTQHQQIVGKLLSRLVQEQRQKAGANSVGQGLLYVVGSSGVEAALVSAWQDDPELLREFGSRQQENLRAPLSGADKHADQLLVVTGSCSPVNRRQLSYSAQHGFELLALDTAKLIDSSQQDREASRVIEIALEWLAKGKSVIIHSCLGPDDPRLEQTRTAMAQQGLSEDQIKLQTGSLLGTAIGSMSRQILESCSAAGRPLMRIGIAGGDSSGFIVEQLQINALEVIRPFTPGAPLCRAHSDSPLDGLQLILKGGQVGADDVWVRLRCDT